MALLGQWQFEASSLAAVFEEAGVAAESRLARKLVRHLLLPRPPHRALASKCPKAMPQIPLIQTLYFAKDEIDSDRQDDSCFNAHKCQDYNLYVDGRGRSLNFMRNDKSCVISADLRANYARRFEFGASSREIMVSHDGIEIQTATQMKNGITVLPSHVHVSYPRGFGLFIIWSTVFAVVGWGTFIRQKGEVFRSSITAASF